jgi:hypothetical protein
VAGYRLERHRQEVLYEPQLTARGERKEWEAHGGHIITFKDWLIGNKRSESDKEEERIWLSTMSSAPTTKLSVHWNKVVRI